jgi:hypothetical protein
MKLKNIEQQQKNTYHIFLEKAICYFHFIELIGGN